MSFVNYLQKIWFTYLVKIPENDLNCFKFSFQDFCQYIMMESEAIE